MQSGRSKKPSPQGARINQTRLAEMIEEATVDCYNESEQVTGWFTMIDDNLRSPSKRWSWESQLPSSASS